MSYYLNDNFLFHGNRFAKTVDLIEARGTAMRDTDFVKGGKTVIVFIKDPDYYKFELLERTSTP